LQPHTDHSNAQHSSKTCRTQSQPLVEEVGIDCFEQQVFLCPLLDMVPGCLCGVSPLVQNAAWVRRVVVSEKRNWMTRDLTMPIVALSDGGTLLELPPQLCFRPPVPVLPLLEILASLYAGLT
jgi:hypothetical protein